MSITETEFHLEMALATLKAIGAGDFDPDMEVAQLISYLRVPFSSSRIRTAVKLLLTNMEKTLRSHHLPAFNTMEENMEFNKVLQKVRELRKAMELVHAMPGGERKFIELCKAGNSPQEVIAPLLQKVCAFKDGSNPLLVGLKEHDYVDKEYNEGKIYLNCLCAQMLLGQMMYIALQSPQLRKKGHLFLSKAELDSIDQLFEIVSQYSKDLEATNSKRLDDFFPEVAKKYLKEELSKTYDGQRPAEDYVMSKLKRNFSAWDFLVLSWNDINGIKGLGQLHTWKYDVTGMKYHDEVVPNDEKWVNSTHYLMIRMPLKSHRHLDRRDALVALYKRLNENEERQEVNKEQEIALDDAFAILVKEKKEEVPVFSFISNYLFYYMNDNAYDRLNMHVVSSSPYSMGKTQYNHKYWHTRRGGAYNTFTRRDAIVSNHLGEKKKEKTF